MALFIIFFALLGLEIEGVMVLKAVKVFFLVFIRGAQDRCFLVCRVATARSFAFYRNEYYRAPK